MTELWKDVPGYEGYYIVSSLGRVRSVPRIAGNGIGRGRCRPIPATVLKTTPDKNGYAKVVLCVDNIRQSVAVHRLVALAFLGEDPHRPYVNHKNGVTNDNRIENLEWVTAAENAHHAIHVLGRQYGRAGSALIACRGSEVRVFATVRDAKAAGFQKAGIYACIWGARPHHKGYQWKRMAAHSE